ncbi:MAG TPA: hypothetical protein EYN03_10255, partial [Planctomycetes bacterium]|nr:hypothetical protein [Planctomycetota bacterium]
MTTDTGTMSYFSQPRHRRHFLQWAGTASMLGQVNPLIGAAWQPAPRPQVAAIFTELRFRSHAYNILENFLQPYLFRGKLTDPGVDVVSFYADQFPDNDMAREVSERFKIPLFKSIDEALCLGSKKLAVDAVLSIGEHGNYPLNKRRQQMYPRKEFFDQSVAVMKRSGRFVPFFNDKHLSYRADWAQEMFETARQYKIPLMAGSSVPLADRRPDLELPAGANIEEAISVHGGGIESYDFHALEVLQSMIESRRGGESGVRHVELLTGDALQTAIKEKRWSMDLVNAAMAAEEQAGLARQARPQSTGSKIQQLQMPAKPYRVGHALCLTYRDGLRATALTVGSNGNRWNFACRLRGSDKPLATSFYNGPWGNRCLFKALSHAIQYLFIHRKEPYPVKRTLLVSNVLDAAMTSHEQGGKRISTPLLNTPYQPIRFENLRENGETWKLITLDSPQPARFEPGDAR